MSNPCLQSSSLPEVARARPRGLGIQVSTSSIRQVLNDAGYYWLPRAKKPKYSTKDKNARREFVESVLEMSPAQLKAKLSMAMDGVVLSVPPTAAEQRAAYCRNGDSHVWRKEGEALDEDLVGRGNYSHQLPLDRAVPLWGGISEKGVAPVTFHASKKLTAEEWEDVVRSGGLVKALREVQPDQKKGPWSILCDNERFLNAAKSREAYAKSDIRLWQIPARSPDLNPIEKYWAWLRRHLRQMDLEDLAKKKPALTKAQYVKRVRGVLQTNKSKEVAQNVIRNFRKQCKAVSDKKGGAARG